jgi:two-component system alkaline phosphatase synthesis response regulator PhoP
MGGDLQSGSDRAGSDPAGSDRAGSDRAHVLIVDDNAQNLELLEVYLEEMEELRTTSATNGLEALEVINRDKPALILLDIMMPKMSGFELCKQLKSNPATRDIVIIMVTALNETADIERATECGTDDYLTKPIDRKALIELIRSHLQAVRARR